MDIHGHIFPLSGWKTHIFSFHLRFPPYPVTTTIIWPTRLNSSLFNFQENVNQENCRQYSSIIFIYIYIYTPVFKKVFIERDIWIDIYTSVPLHVRPCAFFTCCCPTCEKLDSKTNFFVVAFFVPIWHVVLSFFLEKYMRPTTQIFHFVLSNLWKNSPQR